MRYMGGVIHQQTQDSHYDDDDYYSQICVYNTILHSGPPVTQLSQKMPQAPRPTGFRPRLRKLPGAWDAHTQCHQKAVSELLLAGTVPYRRESLNIEAELLGKSMLPFLFGL